MKKLIGILGVLALVLAFVPTIAFPSLAIAATDADVTVNATPQSVSISVDISFYDFGNVAPSDTPSSSTSYFTIDNTSNVQTDQTIRVTSNSWSGGVTWTHSDTATPGADTAGLKANKGGTWGVGDVIIKYNATYNYIAENQAADTDYSFGLKLWAPTSFGDSVEKSMSVVRISAVAG